MPEVILPDPFPAFDSSQDDIQEITPERAPENVLEPEKEKLRTPEKELEPETEKLPKGSPGVPDPQPQVDLVKGR